MNSNTPAATALDDCRCIVFDFDGTLAPNLDLPDMRRQVVALTATYNVPAAVYAERMIVEVIVASNAWLEQHNPSAAAPYAQAAQQRILDIEMEAAAATQLFPAAQPLLERLARENIKSAIVTRNCRAAVLTVFPEANELCDALYCRDDVEHLKPDARHVQAALSATGVPAQQAAMVGDGRLDMQVGAELNMLCIGVLSGSSDAEALTQAGANVVLNSIAEL